MESFYDTCNCKKSLYFLYTSTMWYVIELKHFNCRQDPLNITVVLTFGGHDYTSGFEKQLRGAIFETTKEYRYLNYIVHLIGDVLIVSGRISHGKTRLNVHKSNRKLKLLQT